jgi:hypothetical protein
MAYIVNMVDLRQNPRKAWHTMTKFGNDCLPLLKQTRRGTLACLVFGYFLVFRHFNSFSGSIRGSSSPLFLSLPADTQLKKISTTTTISTRSSFPWMKNLSAGIPVQDRGHVYVSYGLCCSKQAQRETQQEIEQHNHREKPYDVATALSASLWLLQQHQEPKNHHTSTTTTTTTSSSSSSLSIIVVLAYIKGNEESESNLHRIQGWLQRLEGGGIQTWSYDVSTFSDPYAACIRAGQIGRYYVHESGLLQDNDFVMTTDSDIFPIDSNALMPFLNQTNPEGDYHRVFIRDWDFSMRKGRLLIYLILTS